MANLFGCALEEELATLMQYTRRASTALTLGGTGCYEAIWLDQHLRVCDSTTGFLCMCFTHEELIIAVARAWHFP